MDDTLWGTMMRRLSLPGVVLVAASAAFSQPQAEFRLSLDLDFHSAEKSIEIYEGLSGRPAEVAALRGSQLALAVTGMLAQQHLQTADLERSLEAAKFNQSDGDDLFRMRPARARSAAIKELLREVRRRNFERRVVGTIEQLFPPQARLKARIPVYFVAFGHENIDAFVLRVFWKGDTPLPAGESEGEQVVVVNLAKAVSYGESVDERFVGLLSVVAHEIFHAAFGLYKESSPAWRAFYARPPSPFDELLDLAHNEGIAYYLSLIQRTGGRLPADGLQRAQAAFRQFNIAAGELLARDLSPRRAADILRQANTSGYWESYGSMTGMIIARQIDQVLGRTTLVETIADGPFDFFRTYAQLMKRDPGLPQLSPAVQAELSRRSR